MTDLITRLSKLDAPDREVDAEIALQNGWQVFPGDNWIGPEAEIVVPDYTRSVDAAIALAERELPEWQGLYLSTEWTGIKSPRNGITHSAQLRKTLHGYISADGEGANLAIALCIALLRAKEASNAE